MIAALQAYAEGPFDAKLIDKEPEVPAIKDATKQVNSALNSIDANNNYSDPAARLDLTNATGAAMAARNSLEKKARSGEYDTSNEEALKAMLAAGVLGKQLGQEQQKQQQGSDDSSQDQSDTQADNTPPAAAMPDLDTKSIDIEFTLRTRTTTVENSAPMIDPNQLAGADTTAAPAQGASMTYQVTAKAPPGSSLTIDERNQKLNDFVSDSAGRGPASIPNTQALYPAPAPVGARAENAASASGDAHATDVAGKKKSGKQSAIAAAMGIADNQNFVTPQEEGITPFSSGSEWGGSLDDDDFEAWYRKPLDYVVKIRPNGDLAIADGYITIPSPGPVGYSLLTLLSSVFGGMTYRERKRRRLEEAALATQPDIASAEPPKRVRWIR